MTVQPDTASEALIRQKVASGQYSDAAEVIRAALDALEERERFQRLRGLIAEGFASAERGELVELTPELMDELAREADEMTRLGTRPNPDVCPWVAPRPHPAGELGRAPRPPGDRGHRDERRPVLSDPAAIARSAT